MTRDEYVSGIKSAFVTVGTKAAMTVLVSQAPVFASPVLNYIASHLINYILVALADSVEMQVFFIYIDVRTSKQGQEFFKAAVKNRDAKTPQEKADAEKDLIAKFRVFAKLTA